MSQWPFTIASAPKVAGLSPFGLPAVLVAPAPFGFGRSAMVAVAVTTLPSVSETMSFSAVDAAMRVLDEPCRPQTIHLEVEAGDPIDVARLRRAVDHAAALHPMARARQEPASPLAPSDRWSIPAELDADVVGVGGSRDDVTSRHIDVTTRPAFRVSLLGGDDNRRIVLLASHVAMDGVGALRLLQSIGRAYSRSPDPTPAFHPRDAQSALAPAPRPTFTPPSVRPITRLAKVRTSDDSGFGTLLFDLDLAALPSVAGATVNDILLAACAIAIARWNDERGNRADRVSLMMPVNRRQAAWRDDVVANLVSSARVEATAAPPIDARRLLAEVTRQTAKIKRGEWSDPATAMPGRLPVGIRRLLPRVVDAAASLSADTAVLSNLGRLDDPPLFGGVCRGPWFAPPPRDPVVLTIGVATTSAVHVMFRWCRSGFDLEAAGRVAHHFRNGLAALAT